MPPTLRKVSCWPANDASGRSSAVADERTANDAPWVVGWPACSYAVRIAASRSPGSGAAVDPAADLGAGLRQCASRRRCSALPGVRRCARSARRARRNSRKRIRGGGEAAGHAHAAGRQLADHFAEARRSCRRPPRRRSSSAVQTVRPGRSPSEVDDMGELRDGEKPVLPERDASRTHRHVAVRGLSGRGHCMAASSGGLGAILRVAPRALSSARRILSSLVSGAAMPNRTVFFVSDGTGITAETFGNSILAQFPTQPPPRAAALHRHDRQGRHQVVARDQRTSREAEGQAADRLHHAGQRRGARRRHRDSCNGLVLDMFRTFVEPLEAEFGIKSQPPRGPLLRRRPRARSTHDRIEAINFSLAHDDGQSRATSNRPT